MWQKFNNTDTGACKKILIELNKQFDDEPLTYLALGEFYNKIEQYDKAIEVFKTGINKIGNSALLHKDLSISYMKKGDFAEAINALENATSLGLEKKDREQALKLLNALSSRTKNKQKKIIVLGIIHGPYQGHKFVFSMDTTIVLGRDQGTNICLENDEFVSRKHCAIYTEDKHFVIKDTNSKNGTFINGKKINQSILEEEDILIVGNTHIKVYLRNIEGYLISKKI